ncbi:hypothetical protein KJ786_02025 [Patescibacteria group bacterium]|nr:hypothetical protein [Patescibacteria group bacterium]
MNQAITDIISIITSPELQRELLPAKVVFIFFTIVFFVSIIYFIFNSSYLNYQFIYDARGFFNIGAPDLRKTIRRWNKIKKRVKTGVEYEYKLALMEAEELFNDVLKDKGFEGKNFEERVQNVGKIQLPNSEEILEAHGIRNLVAHDPNYKLSGGEINKILEIYERGIKNIESF